MQLWYPVNVWGSVTSVLHFSMSIPAEKMSVIAESLRMWMHEVIFGACGPILLNCGVESES